jgi:hypothetical protein
MATRLQYRGCDAIRLVVKPTASVSKETIAIIQGTDFGDGIIEAEIAGAPAAGASSASN